MSDYAIMPSGYETPATALVPARGNRYDDDLWQLIYEIWAFECDRNAARTHRNVLEKIREEAEAHDVVLDDESLNIPTVRQIQYRARNEDWSTRATQGIASIAPHLYSKFNTRLFAMVDAAQAFDGDLLAGAYNDFHSPGILAEIGRASARVQTLAGVGTAAGLLKPQLPKNETSVLVDENTPITDLGRLMREKLDERREGQR